GRAARGVHLNRKYVELWNTVWNRLGELNLGLTIDFRKQFLDHDSLCLTTYLILAVGTGSLALTELVLQQKPKVNKKNLQGQTAISIAARFHFFDILKAPMMACEHP